MQMFRSNGFSPHSFSDGEAIGDLAVLTAIASECGYNPKRLLLIFKPTASTVAEIN